jgi:hypothetical protein
MDAIFYKTAKCPALASGLSLFLFSYLIKTIYFTNINFLCKNLVFQGLSFIIRFLTWSANTFRFFKVALEKLRIFKFEVLLYNIVSPYFEKNSSGSLTNFYYTFPEDYNF